MGEKPEENVAADGVADEESRVGRRRALEVLGGLTVCAATGSMAGLVSCADSGSSNDPPTSLRMPLGELPDGGRLRVMMGDDPVELLRAGDEVRALSLWCTHWGCEVRWVEGDRVYKCPCHDGVVEAASEEPTAS